jgi:hypothetical protein
MGYASLSPDLKLASNNDVPRRLILAVDGLDKHGKTAFALSAPKPLVYLDFDIGKEGVLQKAPGRDMILETPPFVVQPGVLSWEIDNVDTRIQTIMKDAEKQLTRFMALYKKSLKEPVMTINGRKVKARTIVIDTGSELWELIRLCEFGKTTQVKPHHYTAVNSLMRDLVRSAYEYDVNLIILHKLKAEWKDNAEGKGRKTGLLERSGFEGMSFLVQANLLTYRISSNLDKSSVVQWKSGEATFEHPIDPRMDGDLGFRLVIGNSRHDPALEGSWLMNEDISFANVAQMMIPESTPEDWADTV